jgi:hypothetical protein
LVIVYPIDTYRLTMEVYPCGPLMLLLFLRSAFLQPEYSDLVRQRLIPSSANY